MVLSVWLQLAEVLLKGHSPATEIVSALRILTSSVEKTQEDLVRLIEAPITAGKGFLYRAEIEPEDRISLIGKAQDEFTKLIRFDKKPMLSSRASYYVGYCHSLLGAPDKSRPYIADAFKLVMQTFEECETNRHSLSLKNIFGVEFLQDREAKHKYGISYGFRSCNRVTQGGVHYPFKDEYILSLEKIIGFPIPVCCGDFIESLCCNCRLDSAYVLGRPAWASGTGVKAKSPYSEMKPNIIKKLDAYVRGSD